MLIFGHRGDAWDAPENTIAAIEEGLRQGADGVEVDVRRSQDGVMVVMHDGTFKRTAGFKGKVSKTGSGFIKTLDAGRFKSRAFTGEKVPFLADVLEAVPVGKLLQIEIKSGADTVRGLVRDIKSSHKALSEIIVIGFSRTALKTFKEALPDMMTAWINGQKTIMMNRMQPPEDIIKLSKNWHFDAIDFDCRFSVDSNYIHAVKSGGLGVFSWTVDNPERARYFKEIGVDGIATNKPGFIKDAVNVCK